MDTDRIINDVGVSRSEFVAYIGRIPKFTSPCDIYEMLGDLKLSSAIPHKDIAVQLSDDKETVLKTYVRFSSLDAMREALAAITATPFFGVNLNAEEKSSQFEPFKINKEFETKGFRLVVYPVLTCKQKADIKAILSSFNPMKFVDCYAEKELLIEFEREETIQTIIKSNCLPGYSLYPDERYNKYLSRVKTGEVLVLPQYNARAASHRKE